MFMVRGPGIAPGQIEREIEILDVAPTVCAIFGSPLPGAEGHPLDELWQGARVRA